MIDMTDITDMMGVGKMEGGTITKMTATGEDLGTTVSIVSIIVTGGRKCVPVAKPSDRL